MSETIVPTTEVVTPNQWERQAGEGEEEWNWFCAYRDMERGNRSLIAAWRNVEGKGAGSHPARVSAASLRWDWEVRVAEWDVYREQERAEKHGKEVEQHTGMELEMSKRLFAKAWSMLEYPVATKEVIPSADGTTEIHMHPTGWKPGDVSRLLETASKLGRLSTGQDTERTHVSVTQVLDALPEDVRRLLLPALAELLAKGEG